MRDVRSYRGADVASDHYLVMMRIKIKLKTRDNANSRKKQSAYNVIKLKDKEVHSRYNIELQNRFEALEWATDIEDEWETIKEVINHTAETVIGKRWGTKNERWITEGTWKSIDERRTLKGKKNKWLLQEETLRRLLRNIDRKTRKSRRTAKWTSSSGSTRKPANRGSSRSG